MKCTHDWLNKCNHLDLKVKLIAYSAKNDIPYNPDKFVRDGRARELPVNKRLKKRNKQP